MKKDAIFFGDAWYYHVCPNMNDENIGNESIVFDDLRNRWQMVFRGCEVDINYCPLCGDDLRELDPISDYPDNILEDTCHGMNKEGNVVENQKTIECCIKCMYCGKNVTVYVNQEKNRCIAEDCAHCRAKIEYYGPKRVGEKIEDRGQIF